MAITLLKAAFLVIMLTYAIIRVHDRFHQREEA